jgi:hypothetical protein
MCCACTLLYAESAHLVTKGTVANTDVLQLPVLLQHGAQLGSCLNADGMAAADELLQDSVVLQGTAELSNILQAAATAEFACGKTRNTAVQAYYGVQYCWLVLLLPAPQLLAARCRVRRNIIEILTQQRECNLHRLLQEVRMQEALPRFAAVAVAAAAQRKSSSSACLCSLRQLEQTPTSPHR